jgi:glyoxylase-like metal-dependent hydrolase (beta-lactamase superfamily II)
MFVSLSERVGYVPGGTNVGIIRNDDRHVSIIDSGLNDTTARKVLRVVRDELQSEIVAILNTHGHADHFGANAFVHKRTDCEVWAPEIESTIIQYPILQPSLLFGGADPMDTLRNKFLLAEASPLTGMIGGGVQDFHGTTIDLIPLPGHSPNQMGVLVDDVFFCADVVFPESAIEKYRVPYLFGLTDHLSSLNQSLTVPAKWVVPGHGDHAVTIEPLVALNQHAIERTLDEITEVLSAPMTSDDVCAEVFRALDVPVTDAQSYFLLKPTISAYLAHLDRIGMAQLDIVNKRALWRLR